MSALDDQANRLEVAARAILDLRPRVEAGGPWPPAELFGTEDEASWNPPELLAHVEEMLPFWLGELERILAGPSATPVPFGRVASDTIRIGVIGRDRTIPLRELFARVAADSGRVAARLRELGDAEAARLGVHPRVGELTVEQLVERFMTGHLEGHVVQLREILESRGL
ncbi:MAG: DinB family protein [Chloroflexota bacterium]